MEKKQLIVVMASALPPLTAFHLGNLWTLWNAFSITFIFACDIVHTLICSRHTTSQPFCMYHTTDNSDRARKEACMMTTADADDLLRRTAMLWCSTPQAVAGTLALLLPCHRKRLRQASAYAGLMVAIAGHCILASAVRAIVVDDPAGDLLIFRIVGNAVAFVYAVCDLLGFLAGWLSSVDYWRSSKPI